MREIERYLDDVCASLGGSRSSRRRLREELRQHLLEAVEAHVAGGLSEERAVRKAIEEFGEPASVREDLKALYGRRLAPALILRATALKERIMKNGWRWGLVRDLALAAIPVLGCFVLALWGRFMVPIVVQAGEELDAPLRGVTILVLRVFVLWERTWPIWLAGVVVLWIAFELLCKSDRKRTIRLALGALACLGVTLLLCAVSTGLMVTQGDMLVSACRRCSEQEAAGGPMTAEPSLAALSSAVDTQARRLPGNEP
jgi:hypothetical protein